MKRTKTLFVVAIAAILLCAFGAWLFLASSRTIVSKLNYSQVIRGMSKKEVHAIYGEPYDNFNGGERFVGYDGSATVNFDHTDHVNFKDWDEFPHRTHFPENIFHPLQWPND